MTGRIITNAHVAATLRVAASALDVQGWHRDDYSADLGDTHGKACCALGAIAIAAGMPADAWEEDPQDADAALAHLLMVRAGNALGHHVGAIRPDREYDEPGLAIAVGNWNDQQTDAETVIRALRDTAGEVDRDGVAAA